MSFINQWCAQVLLQEVRLRHAWERLVGGHDSEALHDLRIHLRRLRSLLYPLRRLPGSPALLQAAGNLARQTSSARDLEVLIAELSRHGAMEQARRRQASLVQHYRQIIGADAAQRLWQTLEQWPHYVRQAQLDGETRQARQQVRKRLDKQARALQVSLSNPGHDRHQLRIQIKKLRYLLDAFPAESRLPADLPALLKGAQSALGDWHDHYQWRLRSEHEADLQPLALQWEHVAEQARQQAEPWIERLAKSLSA